MSSVATSRRSQVQCRRTSAPAQPDTIGLVCMVMCSLGSRADLVATVIAGRTVGSRSKCDSIVCFHSTRLIFLLRSLVRDMQSNARCADCEFWVTRAWPPNRSWDGSANNTANSGNVGETTRIVLPV
ncbi:hypothetical protein ACJJTC_003750 [Scirpophaga incertulas]